MEGPRVAHLPAADPYGQQLRPLAVEVGREQGVDIHDGGTVVVIQGPRFATRAESRGYGAQGWHVINMTQYPEVVLARELDMCYVNIALVTDYVADVASVMTANNERVRRLILALIERLPDVRSCTCGDTMRTAFIS
jgi:5'-methylthioadenosine phosphorylase